MTVLTRLTFMASMAAAQPACHYSGSLTHSRRAIAKFAKRQIVPVLSPHMCHYGGCSRACRRFLWRNSRKSVAAPVFAAAHFGDNNAKTAMYVA